MIAITAATLFTPLERIEKPILFLEDGKISESSSRDRREIPANCRIVDYGNAILAPAFIDIHVHGAAGRDVMETSPEAMRCVEELLARHGVGSYFPTTVTASVDITVAALARLADAIEKSPKQSSENLRARPVGIHLEGPFLSHARRGVHPTKDLILPSLNVFERFWEASRGHIRIMTIAPELEGALQLITEASKRGVCVSLGHSDADLETTHAAVNAGARHATHLFNGMRPLSHRDPGIVGESLTNPSIAVEIIADGIHLNPSIVKLTIEAKGQRDVILITDGTAATGMPDGRYHLGTFEFDVKDGICLSDGKLAGSTLTMDRAVRNVMDFADYDLQQAIILATANPGRAVSPRTGKLQAGGDANVVVLGPDGELRNTIIGSIGI
ncbi:MAG TPA: N-acetylglucosamine-6-phosphate deacetylase [Terriglobales bacterium]|jgi:N-acetylglucosamine-6-phosphate deacetylase|nr:N-acetylglucosamine-6-phosphate deacetylase [Terriglobales bacterium]